MEQEIYYNEIMLGGLVWISEPKTKRRLTAWEKLNINSPYGIFKNKL